MMKRICNIAFAVAMSLGMMTNYCMPAFAEEAIEESNEGVTSDDLKERIESIKIEDRKDIDQNVSIEVTFNDNECISDAKLNIRNHSNLIIVENPEINDNVYTFINKFNEGTYTIESLELKYNGEQYVIDIDNADDTSFNVLTEEQGVESSQEENIKEAENHSSELFQNGGLGFIAEESDGISVYNESSGANDWDTQSLRDCLYNSFKNKQETINITSYNVPDSSQNDFNNLFWGIFNEHADLLVSAESYFYSYGYYGGQEIITNLYVTYTDADYDEAAFTSAVNEARSVIDSSMSDLEKAIALHDYLAVNVSYDEENYENGSIPDDDYNAYGALVNKCAVCNGYALAYKYLCNLEGIDCYMVRSSSMNHAWNLIKINGNYYHVDVTWDDPVWDHYGLVNHKYMFRSDAEITGHYDWSVLLYGDVVPLTASNTYDSYYWTNISSPMIKIDNNWYYILYQDGVQLLKSNSISSKGTTLLTISENWPVYGDTDGYFYSAAYSGLFKKGNTLYFNDYENVYSYNLLANTKNVEYTVDTTVGYLYGIALQNDDLYGAIRQSPNTKKDAYLPTKLGQLGESQLDSGTCGDNLTWTLDGNGLLTISGSGAMTNYSSATNIPWINDSASIKAITIQNGVTSIGNYAFSDCTGLTSVTIPSSVTSIGKSAFYGCSGLTSVTIPSSVTSIGECAFSYCYGLASIEVDENNKVYDSRDDCNAIIKTSTKELVAGCKNTIIPSSVTSIGTYAFYRCGGLTSITIPSSVTSIGNYAFWNCYGLTGITIPKSVTTIGGSAFNACSKLKAIRLYKNSTADDYYDDDTYNKVYLDDISSDTDSLYSGISGSLIWSIDSNGLLKISGTGDYDLDSEDSKQPKWCDYADNIISAVVNVNGITTTNCMFLNCSKLESLDLSELDTSKVTNMYHMFGGCSSLTSLDLSHFDTRNVTWMNNMFGDCSALTSIDLSGFDTSKVTNMGMMFYGCKALTSLDVTGFNTGKVTSMNAMFSGCKALTSLDVTGFDTSNVTGMGMMFDGCKALTSLDVTGFDTSKVTSMNAMFSGCQALTSLDLSGFDTSNVMNIAYMFWDCENLSTNITLAISSNCTYSGCFDYSATNANAKIYVNYSGECTKDLAEAVVATKGDASHVYLEGTDTDCQLEGYSLSLSGDIGVNFYMTLSDRIVSDANAYMKFTSPNGTTSQVNVSEAKTVEGDGNTYYVFPCHVSAKNMTSIIKAQFFDKDGNELTDEYSYTVEEYADYLINYASSMGYTDEEVSIVKAMLTYGYYTQEYFGYNTNNLPGTYNTLSNVDLSSYKYQLTDNNSSIDFVGARLVLTSKPGLKLYFKGSGTFQVDGKKVSTTTEAKYTVVTISDIDDMTNMYSITSTNFKLTYGIFSYGYVASKTSNTDLKNLIYAMYAYDQALKG